MIEDRDRALRAVLDEQADQDVPSDQREGAEYDIAAIRRGLTLLAAEAGRALRAVDGGPALTSVGRQSALEGEGRGGVVRRVSRRPWWRRSGVAAAAGGLAVAAAVAGVVALNPGSQKAPDGQVVAGPLPAGASSDVGAGPGAEGTGAPSPGATVQAPALAPPLALAERVAAAERIVVGTITGLDRGVVQQGGGAPYVLATVRVTEAIKGAKGDVVALAWDYTGVTATDEVDSRPWDVGDRVLLFLVSDRDSIFADIRPAHLQVSEGKSGRYFIDGGRLAGVDFTLEDVRRLAR